MFIHNIVFQIEKNKMLKTIIRYGCRLRPTLNMRLSTSVNHRLHTLSPSSTYQNGQVCKKKLKVLFC